jgi:hypothetical protein
MVRSTRKAVPTIDACPLYAPSRVFWTRIYGIRAMDSNRKSDWGAWAFIPIAVADHRQAPAAQPLVYSLGHGKLATVALLWTGKDDA